MIFELDVHLFVYVKNTWIERAQHYITPRSMYQWKSAKVVPDLVEVWGICFVIYPTNVYNFGILQVYMKIIRERKGDIFTKKIAIWREFEQHPVSNMSDFPWWKYVFFVYWQIAKKVGGQHSIIQIE